jgi:DNA-binding IclR family transcriptional regulator
MTTRVHQLSATELAQLTEWVRSQTSPHRLVVRSRIVLLASHGAAPAAIAERLHVSPATVRLWCERFEQHGLAALTHDAPGRGRRPGMTPVKVVAALRGMRHFVDAGLPCTVRAVAAWAHVSPATVWRVCQRCHVSAQSTTAEIDAALDKAISETRKDVA